MFRGSRLGLAAALVSGLLVLSQTQTDVHAESSTEQNKQSYIIQAGDDFWRIGKIYNISPLLLANANNTGLYNPLQVGKIVYLPETNNVISRGLTLNKSTSSSGFEWPVIGQVSSNFGQRKGSVHEGIDIAVAKGVEVNAARGGKVVYAGWITGYGYTVKIEHEDGYLTLYAHNSKLLVKKGEQVLGGQVIAKAGSTGRSTGPHLHFEIRHNGTAQNPLINLKKGILS